MLSFLFIALTINVPSAAFAATIKVVTPDALDDFMNNGAIRVFVDGVIDENTPHQLEGTLKNLGDGVWVFLNSTGGSLFAGLNTGRILRKYSSTTYVGEYSFTGKQKSGPRVYDIKPGRCESACAFVFMGGHFRFMSSQESRFGVHRFWSTTGATSNDLDRGQIVTAAIANYLAEMQIDAELMTYMASAGKSEMNYLNTIMLKKLNITNDGRATAQWKLDIGKDVGTFLSGYQEVMTGGGTINIYCKSGSFFMGTTALVGIDNANMIVGRKYTPYLLIKKIKHSFPDSLDKVEPFLFKADGANVKSIFVVPNKIEQLLDHIDAIGIGYFNPDNPFYIGFIIDIGVNENRDRIKRFLSHCK